MIMFNMQIFVFKKLKLCKTCKTLYLSKCVLKWKIILIWKVLFLKQTFLFKIIKNENFPEDSVQVQPSF